jgi:hypothetical protein
MISKIPPPSSRIRRIVLVALFAIFASVIFVAAQKSDDNPANVAATQPPDAPAKTRAAANFGKLPLSFELNKGQIDQPVKFLSRGLGYDLFLTANEAVLRVNKPRALQPDKPKEPNGAKTDQDANVREGAVLRLKMLGANAAPQVEGQEELPGKVNYFIGNDPAKWRRNVPTYRKVYFKDVYPGIDVVYYGKQRELEYDYVVGAGANPKLIRFTVEGADQLRLDKSGSLLLKLKFGEVSLNKPVIYQLDENGSRREVKGTYVINGNEVRFKLEKFDSSKSLVIDPVLSYSTLLGSTSGDVANGIAVDAQGNAYVTGTTDFTGFPTTPGAFKSTATRGGAFVTKLDPTGSTLVYSTYLATGGFNGNTNGFAIAVDSAGNAHVTGNTNGNDFPIVNGLKTTSSFFKTTDAAANWNNQNAGLVGDVNFLGVGPNASNTIYASTTDGFYRSTDAGATWTKATATGLSSPSSVQALAADPTNASVVYVSLFNSLYKSTDGGNNFSQINTLPVSFPSVNSVVFDPVTPSTMYLGTGSGVFKSTDSGSTWITQNNFNVAGTPGIRVLAIDPTTPLTIYAGTFNNGIFKSINGGGVWTAMNTGMGGPSPLNINTIAIDPSNTATIYTGHGSSGGINKSTNGGTSWAPLTNGLPQFPVVNAMVVTSAAVYAAFSNSGVLKSTNGGDSWTSANTGLWSSSVRALVRNSSDPSTLYAGTTSANFVTDAFVTKLNASGSGLLFSTLLGGTNDESGNGIAVDTNGNIYVVGQTSSLNFPVANAIQSAPATNDGCSTNAFVTKYNPSVPSYVFSTYLRGTQCDSASGVAVDGSGNVYVTGSTNSTDFFTLNAFQPALAGPGQFNSDAFVTKLTTDGAAIYSTYLGGSNGTENGIGIAADASGNAYITGFTNSSNFPLQNAIQPTFGANFSTDAFVTKINSQGSALVYSTFLGGNGADTGRGIAVDSANNAYVTGSTTSLDFPVVAGTLRTKSPMYKSIDAAANWTNDNFGFSSTAITSMVIDPQNPSNIYAGTQNGVFKSTNNGRTWTAKNNGLTTNLNVAAIVINPSTPSTLYVAIFGCCGGAGVYKTTNSGDTWNLKNTGIIFTDLMSLAIDPVTPNTLYLGVSFCCGSGSHIYKTTDGGDQWSFTGTGPLAPVSLAVDPLNHTTLYAADSASPGGIFKSTDGSATWQTVGFNQTGGFGRSVSVSPLTAGLVYADAGNGLFKSVDGGSNWTSIPNRTGKIVFDPVSPSTVYLLAPNFSSTPGLFKSTDNGQTWVEKNKGLNSPQAVALVIDPFRPSTLYLASPTPFSGLDAFVTKINPAGSALIYSTFIGGAVGADVFNNISSQANGIAVDGSGNAYITGFTSSQGFPATPGAFQPFNRGGNDAFITKLGMSFNISGQVLSNGVTPLSGAEVVLNDGGTLTSVFTESDGTYQFTRLREGGSFTVSASAPHFTMTPASQTFNNLSSDQTLNFTANTSDSNFFSIDGQVTENGVGLAGVTVTLSGSQSGLRTTDSNGNYSFTLIMNGNYTVTPSTLGFTFAPPSQTFNNLLANQTANFTANRQSFVVTNVNNHGSGSLREAITNANATPGTDTITFNIPSAGVKTINLLTALPDITERVVIDATTQPGYQGTPIVELDGTGLNSGNGLVIKASGSTVRGLAIGRFTNAGISLNGSNNNVIQANYIGLAADGITARPNSRGILLVSNSSNNVIGGTTATARNVISGNQSGIELSGNANVVQGNFIGTNAAGTAVPSNGSTGTQTQGIGVSINSSQFTDNVIGGTAAGAGNLISGNSTGLSISGNNTTIQGNLIGTDVTGTSKLPNATGVGAFANNVLVGGVTPGARNVISGNSSSGVNIRGTGNTVQGNYIGTDITGALALGNTDIGITAFDSVLIGGTTPEARNIISANGSNQSSTVGNIVLGNSFSGNPPTPATVQGNYIGTDVTGTRALGGTAPGITILTNNNIIGGTAAGARNVISGNSIGIQLGVFFSGGLTGNIIKGNYIGLNAAGTGPVPNTQQGITIADSANNIIGGIESEAGNKIAFNGGAGITLSGGVGNAIRGNSIFSNNGLGIDLTVNSVAGVTPNDATDADTGPNNLQNFPVITGVLSSANSTTIQGSLKSIPLTTFQIDFYSNAAVDPSGNGEGAQYFNTASVTTDANGDATINATFPAGLPSGRVITSTATDPNGNTSEFSAVDSASAGGSVQFTVSSIQVIEDVGALTVTVLRTGGASGNLSVDYATADGTAIAGQDYTATSGTLNFAGGETSKTFQIPITDDATTEQDETFRVELRNASTLEALGSPSLLLVTLQDRSTVPTVFVTSPSVVEGNTGSTTDLVFTINLSAATGRAVSGNFAASNAGAFGGIKCNNNDGVDYVNTSGPFSFQPGTTTFLVPVKICGDTSAEANEAVRILLSNLTGATFSGNLAFGTIVDDDVLSMLLEESGPNPNQAAALDAVLGTRDPFRALMPDWFASVPPNTRVMLFAQNLQLNPGEPPGAVFVRLTTNNIVILQVPAEDVRALRNSEFTQVVFRIPPGLAPGTYTVQIFAHTKLSNSGTIRIVP